MAVVSTGQQADLREPAGWRRAKSRIATVLMWLSFVLVIIPLGFVLFTVIAKGASVISWQFLTSPIPPSVLPANVGGMGPAIVGTLVITGLATVMAVPLGILGAVYLNEYGGKNWLARLIGFFSDVMTGVPSIVMGLFIFSIWVLHFGFSGLAGAFALACLMLPVVIRSTDEMLKLVPDALREGSYALGATKARVTVTVVLPAAIGGIVSGALLAVARAAGETAPLLFTILTVIHRQPERVQRRQHVAALADLREREFVVCRRPGTGLGRGAHADRDRVHPHDRRPFDHRTIQQICALGKVMEESQQKIVTNLPQPEVVAQPQADMAATGEAIFDVRNVSIWYSAFKAVTDVSMSIHEHEITAFIGSSGSGKTTVLRAFNRMNDLVPGARVEGDMSYRGASLYGKDVSPIAVRRRIGMVFQKPNPFPKSIYDNVAYGPRINGEHNKAKLNEIVERSLRQRRAVG